MRSTATKTFIDVQFIVIRFKGEILKAKPLEKLYDYCPVDFMIREINMDTETFNILIKNTTNKPENDLTGRRIWMNEEEIKNACEESDNLSFAIEISEASLPKFIP